MLIIPFFTLLTIHTPYRWSATAIRYILEKREYMGHTVLGKTITENYKTKKRRKARPEELMIYKQPVGQHMALTVSGPVPGQGVVPVFLQEGDSHMARSAINALQQADVQAHASLPACNLS